MKSSPKPLKPLAVGERKKKDVTPALRGWVKKTAERRQKKWGPWVGQVKPDDGKKADAFLDLIAASLKREG